MGVKQSLVNTPHNQSSINTVLSFLVKLFARKNNHTKGKSEVAVHSFVEVIYQVRNVIAVITPCPVRLLDVLSLRLFLMQHTRTLLQCYQTNLRYRQCLDIEHRWLGTSHVYARKGFHSSRPAPDRRVLECVGFGKYNRNQIQRADDSNESAAFVPCNCLVVVPVTLYLLFIALRREMLSSMRLTK